LDLHHEIERLCSALREANDSIARKDVEIATIEAKFHEDNERLSTEMSKLRERYDRLLANHQHLSKLNHELEAKLLQTIENTTTEKKVMADHVAAMKARLAEVEDQLALIKAERVSPLISFIVDLQFMVAFTSQHNFGIIMSVATDPD
ncbi:hypothetical protein FBUS_08639, partial [Fasciolopsis buskii]